MKAAAKKQLSATADSTINTLLESSSDLALAHLRSADPVLAAIIERIGPYAMQYHEPTFHALVRSIVFQQLHGKAARTIFDRLVNKAGGEITPDSILKLRPNQMRAVGLSRQKLTYIRDLARKTRDGIVEFERFPHMRDDEIVAELTEVKGIGTWTAHMFLIFALRRPNVLPTGDYGVRAAIQRAYKKRKLPTPKQVEILARKNNWHPYCSVAAWYLWRSIDGGGA